VIGLAVVALILAGALPAGGTTDDGAAVAGQTS
jgi:hypothetical protein